MKANTRLLVKAVLLLIAVAIAGYLIQSRSTETNPTGKDTAGPKVTARGNPNTQASADHAARARERAKDRRALDNAELVAQYGESRTNLLKHVTNNILGILDDAVQMQLEQLDSSIESARKVTTGLKSMMDGMGGINALMEQPQKPGGKLTPTISRATTRNVPHFPMLNQPPFLRPQSSPKAATGRPVRPTGSFRGLPQEANPSQSGHMNPVGVERIHGTFTPDSNKMTLA